MSVTLAFALECCFQPFLPFKEFRKQLFQCWAKAMSDVGRDLLEKLYSMIVRCSVTVKYHEKKSPRIEDFLIHLKCCSELFGLLIAKSLVWSANIVLGTVVPFESLRKNRRRRTGMQTLERE
eukprot:IDg12331t1